MRSCSESYVVSPSRPRRRVRQPRHRSLAEYKQAIADHFVEFVRWLDIRTLWTEGGTTFFRVNFWSFGQPVGEATVVRSAFVAVDGATDGLHVRNLSRDSAHVPSANARYRVRGS